ncbi:vacuolar protein sorting-associated protein 52 A [Hordeum vulgare]|nr:vacuolar protein sorting-associated protein 52 A [Hordeum vulgare]
MRQLKGEVGVVSRADCSALFEMGNTRVIAAFYEPRELIMFKRRIPCLDSYLDKVNMSLWPRFKMVFDLHLSSLRNANIKTLWEDDVHPHYVTRRYAEFIASLVHLNVEYGDGQSLLCTLLMTLASILDSADVY